MASGRWDSECGSSITLASNPCATPASSLATFCANFTLFSAGTRRNSPRSVSRRIGIPMSWSGRRSLIRTRAAAALAVAIRAVFVYNIFAARLHRREGELEGFGTEILAMMVREGRI